MTLKGDVKFMTEGIWLIFMPAVESLNICTLMGSFCPKHIKF